MDYLRSGYETEMRFYPGLPSVRVRWFRADPEAAVFDLPNAFGSSVWAKDTPEFTPPESPDDVGEIPSKHGKYFGGSNDLGYPGLSYCGRPEAWAGRPDFLNDVPVRLDSKGYSECCGPPSVVGDGMLWLYGTHSVIQRLANADRFDFEGPGLWVAEGPWEFCGPWLLCWADLDLGGAGDVITDLAPVDKKPIQRLVRAEGPTRIVGIVPAAPMQALRLVNATDYPVTLANGGVVSQGAYPVAGPGGADLVIPPAGSVDLWAHPDSAE
jgi:hypothetical protein